VKGTRRNIYRSYVTALSFPRPSVGMHPATLQRCESFIVPTLQRGNASGNAPALRKWGALSYPRAAPIFIHKYLRAVVIPKILVWRNHETGRYADLPGFKNLEGLTCSALNSGLLQYVYNDGRTARERIPGAPCQEFQPQRS